MTVDVSSQPRRAKVELDLGEDDVRDLASSIYEARSYLEQATDGGNWRSDPAHLLDLEQHLWNWLGERPSGEPR